MLKKSKKLIFHSFVSLVFLVGGAALSATDSELRADRMIKSFDKSGNGTVEANEVNLSFRVRRFRRVDLNKDRALDRSELIEMYENLRKAREQGRL